MKFAEHLTAHITPEWRKQYINYEEMKAMLYLTVEEAPSAETVDPEIVTRHYRMFDEQFFHYCDSELKKINTFYSEKFAEATRKFAALHSELKTAATPSADAARQQRQKSGGSGSGGGGSGGVGVGGSIGGVRLGSAGGNDRRVPLSARKVQEFKTAFSEFYLSLILLQNYQSLNHTGFRKILKKHDKLLSVDVGARWHVENVEASHFYTNKDIDKLIHDTEATFINHLEQGDRQKAMKRLRVPPLGEQRSPWTTFKVGLFSGSFIVLLIAVVLSAIFHEGSTENLRIAFRLYRGPLLIIEFLFLMGVNVYGWRSSGVNHVLIFELDPRNHLSEQDLMELAAIFGVVWTLSILSFLYSTSLSIPPYVNPLSLTVIMVLFLVNPVNVFRHDARYWFLKICVRMVGAPFFHVNFADFWLADQLNSLVGALLDFQFLICFYITNGNWLEAGNTSECQEANYLIRPIVNCIPAWIRFAQCLRRYRDTKEAFPHLVNAGKYSSTFFAVIFATLRAFHKDEYEDQIDNPYLYLWFISSIISSCYAYTWDIKMDWGLFDKSAGENHFLREEIVYSSTLYYYAAIVLDLLLRFAWALSFYLTETQQLISGDLMTSILAPLEVFRRFMWNFFRLENEHLNNCGKFRAVRDISVAPIDQSDQTQIIRMMDDEDGVVNRRKRKQAGKKKEEKRSLLAEDQLSKPSSDDALGKLEGGDSPSPTSTIYT